MMPTNNCQKIKLVRLLDLLQRGSDPEHPITTGQLCQMLIEQNISCDRRTLHKDIKTLNAYGYEVMDTMIGHERAFYIEDRSFSIPELKILMDAVQAASFITDKKTAVLLDKIAALGGAHRAEVLKGNMVCFNTRKHSNEQIFYTVNTLEEAIAEQRMASFLYFDLNENGEHIYRKEKQRYVVEPLALVFHEDNYYLVSYSSKYEHICNYRLDRMEQIAVEKGFISPKALALSQRQSMGTYTKQVFKMYGGEETTVTLSFPDHLIGVVYDKFGEGITIFRRSPSLCETTVTVQISPTFWGWLFQFAGDMRIVYPERMGKLCLEQLSGMMDKMTHPGTETKK